MIAVDTNVLVRLVTGDDPEQTRRAAALFASERILVAKTVLLECEWVLRYSYGFDSAAIRDAFEKLLGLAQVQMEDALVVDDALALYARGMDFADALHVASSRTAEAFVTFDVRLCKRADGGVRLL